MPEKSIEKTEEDTSGQGWKDVSLPRCDNKPFENGHRDHSAVAAEQLVDKGKQADNNSKVNFEKNGAPIQMLIL